MSRAIRKWLGNGVSEASVWREVLDLLGRQVVIVAVQTDRARREVVAHVRPRSNTAPRCGRCGARAGLYDRGEGRRRWRHLDACDKTLWVEADAPRVDCPTHGATVVRLPWARHGAGHTYAFDQKVCWLVVRASKTTVSQLMRIGWGTVGRIGACQEVCVS